MQNRDSVRANNRPDAATLLLITLSVLMALILGVLVYDVGAGRVPDDELDLASVVDTNGDPERIECNAAVLERAICPDGSYCNVNVCEPIPQVPVCLRDQGCRDRCVCAQGKVCHHNTCVDPKDIVRKPRICEEDKQLAAAVRTLAQKCATRKRDVGDIASSGACSTKDWEELAMEDERFDLLLAAFPNRFAVHFPNGEPKPPQRGRKTSGKTWPDQETRGHYLAQLRQFRDVLLASRQIFVIGRPSPDASAKSNHDISVQRLSFVISLIESVLWEGVPETERAKVRRPVWSFVLPKANFIDPAQYRQTYIASAGEVAAPRLNSMITWDSESHATIEAGLTDTALLEAKAGRKWQELFGMLNRVVLIVPIPCLGDEAEKVKTILPQRSPGAGAE